MDRFKYICGVLALFLCHAAVRAGDSEQRDYVIHVDGKEVGASSMTIIQQDDGTSYMKAKVVVNVRKLVFINYTYQVETEEWWKQGKLIGAKTNANDNGKKFEVLVRPEKNGLALTVNGQQKLVTDELWTSSYWKLADAKHHNNKVPILETDTGRELIGKLEYVGTEQLPVAGTPTKVFRFKVTGIANPVDLWFDSYHRLVRQEFTEDGFKTIVHLSQIRR